MRSILMQMFIHVTQRVMIKICQVSYILLYYLICIAITFFNIIMLRRCMTRNYCVHTSYYISNKRTWKYWMYLTQINTYLIIILYCVHTKKYVLQPLHHHDYNSSRNILNSALLVYLICILPCGYLFFLYILLLAHRRLHRLILSIDVHRIINVFT